MGATQEDVDRGDRLIQEILLLLEAEPEAALALAALTGVVATVLAAYSIPPAVFDERVRITMGRAVPS